MRRVACFVALGLGACEPDIYSGAYYCGPALACPDEQACDRLSETCVPPDVVGAFACPADSEAAEPDDDVPAAAVVALACLNQAEIVEGCLADGADGDVTHFTIPPACVGNQARFDLRTALAFGDVMVEVTDAAGTALPTTACTAPAASPPELTSCLAVPAAPADVYVRMTIDPDADCDGACAFNRTTLSVTVAAS